MTNRNPYQNPPEAPPVVSTEEEGTLVQNPDGSTSPTRAVHEQLLFDPTTGSSHRRKTTLQFRGDDGVPITDPLAAGYVCIFCGKSRLHEQSVDRCAGCTHYICKTCQHPVNDPDAGPIILCPICEAQTHWKRLLTTLWRWLFILRW